MRVCDQFTDERIARFFPPSTDEMEVHSTVDMTGTPSVVGLGLELPIAIIGSEVTEPRGANPESSFNNGVRLTQGESIIGLQSYRTPYVGAQRAPRQIHEEDMEGVFGQSRGASPLSLDGLTHTIVELDYLAIPTGSERYLRGTPFEESEAAVVLPIDEPMPDIHGTLGDRTAFVVKAFVDKEGKMVDWHDARGGARWLVDLCVLNTYAHNRVELGLLQFALGNEAALTGLVATRSTVKAYLKAFDEGTFNESPRGLAFTPNSEASQFGSERRFPEMNGRERARLSRLRHASYIAATTAREKLK